MRKTRPKVRVNIEVRASNEVLPYIRLSPHLPRVAWLKSTKFLYSDRGLTVINREPLQISLFGHSLYKFVHEGDCRELAKNITPDHLQGIVSTSSLFPTNPQIADTASDCSNSSDEASSFQEQRRTFELRMMKHVASTKQDHVQYERIRFTGLLKLADTCKISEVNASGTRHRGKSYHF